MAGPLFVRLRLGEGAEVVRSQVIHDGGADKVFFHFERPTQDGFDSARCELHSYTWTTWEGHFSSADIRRFEELLRGSAC